MDDRIEELSERAKARLAAQREAEATKQREFERSLQRFMKGIEAVIELEGERPVLRYYASDGRNGCNPVKRVRHGEWGIKVLDRYDSQRDETGNRGEYGGWRLYALIRGGFCKLTRTGTWSAWQAESNQWEATVRQLTTAEVSTEMLECRDEIEHALVVAFEAAAASEEHGS